jgi:hypothetical protein
MPERTIISPHYSWLDGDDLRTEFRGAIITISDEEAAKGDALNCFLETRVEIPRSGEDVTPTPGGEFVEESPQETPKRRRASKPTRASGA